VGFSLGVGEGTNVIIKQVSRLTDREIVACQFVFNYVSWVVVIVGIVLLAILNVLSQLSSWANRHNDLTLNTDLTNNLCIRAEMFCCVRLLSI